MENTTNPSGSVQVEQDTENVKQSALGGKAKIETKVNDFKKDLPKLGEDAKKASKEAAARAKKEYDASKGPVKKFLQQIADRITYATSYVVDSTYSASLQAKEELKNPVVATQTVVAIGAITGLVCGIQERAKIFRNKTDGEITAILAGLVGFVVLDGYLFVTNYDKYSKKKSLK